MASILFLVITVKVKIIMSKMVSVVMCVYNGESFIEESICSIMNQTYGNIELIIVNDGSDDNTSTYIDRMMEKYQDRKIIKIEKENTGLTDSLNVGLNQANGYYVARQDADDISIYNRIEKCVRTIEESDYDILTTKFERFDGVNTIDIRPYNSWFYRYGVDIGHLKYGNVFCHGSFFIKSNVIKKLSYDVEKKKSQDYDFLLRALKENFKIGFLDEVLYKLRIHDSSISVISKSDQLGFAKSSIESNYGTSFYFMPNANLIKKTYLYGHRFLYGTLNAIYK